MARYGDNANEIEDGVRRDEATGPSVAQQALRHLLAVMIMLGAFTGITVASATPAAASCSSSGPQGDWRNTNPNTTAMTRVVVETCQWVVTCSGSICSGSHSGTFMTPYGKCSPTDCNWGRQQAQYMGDGWYRTIHSFGFKTSYVWAKTYPYYGTTYLRLWVYNDFSSSDGRSDYTTDEWFLR